MTSLNSIPIKKEDEKADTSTKSISKDVDEEPFMKDLSPNYKRKFQSEDSDLEQKIKFLKVKDVSVKQEFVEDSKSNIQQLTKDGINSTRSTHKRSARNIIEPTALHLACIKGQYEIAKKLIENGVDVNILNIDNNNALHYASRAYKPNQKLLNMLIEVGLNANARNKSGQTALHLACGKGYEEIAKKLIENGADVNILDNDNNNAFHYASRIYRLNEKLLMMLIDAGLDVNARNKKGQTALHQLVQNGIQADILDSDGNTILHYASRAPHGCEKIIDKLTKTFENVNVCNKYGETALHVACSYGNVYAVNQILKKVNAQNNPLLDLDADGMLGKSYVDINAKNSSGSTALHLACRNGYLEIMKELILSKADVNILDDEKNTVLLCALESEETNVDIVKFLVKEGVDIHVKNIYGVNALLSACENNLCEVAKYLVDKGADVNVIDEEINTPLYYAYLAENKDVELIDKILQKSININIKNDNNVTVLHLACENGDSEMVKKLLEKQADTNVKNVFDETPLHIAVNKGYNEIVSLLCKKKYRTDPKTENFTGETPFDIACRRKYHTVLETLINSEIYDESLTEKKKKNFYRACSNGNHEIVEVLLKKYKINIDSRQETNSSPIYVATHHGHYKIVKLLIQYKFDLNVQNAIGATPLWIACHEGHHEIVKLLITHGAEADLANKDEWTPLHIACHKGQTEVVKILMNRTSYNGHSPQDKFVSSDVDKDGSTPLHHACYSGKKEVVEILIPVKNWINMVNKEKETPLFVACFMGYLDIVRVLVENGADQKIGRDDGLTPLKVAEERNHNSIIQFLKNCSR